MSKAKHYAKAIVAFLGALATLLVQVIPSLPAQWQERLAVVIPFATFVTVYLVPNAAKVLDEAPVGAGGVPDISSLPPIGGDPQA